MELVGAQLKIVGAVLHLPIMLLVGLGGTALGFGLGVWFSRYDRGL